MLQKSHVYIGIGIGLGIGIGRIHITNLRDVPSMSTRWCVHTSVGISYLLNMQAMFRSSFLGLAGQSAMYTSAVRSKITTASCTSPPTESVRGGHFWCQALSFLFVMVLPMKVGPVQCNQHPV